MLACDLDLSLAWLRRLDDLRDGRFLGGNWKLRPPGSAFVEDNEAVNYFVIHEFEKTRKRESPKFVDGLKAQKKKLRFFPCIGMKNFIFKMDFNFKR